MQLTHVQKMYGTQFCIPKITRDSIYIKKVHWDATYSHTEKLNRNKIPILSHKILVVHFYN
jgi:hypothetical protein